MFGCVVQGGEGGGLLAEGDSTVVAAHSKVRTACDAGNFYEFCLRLDTMLIVASVSTPPTFFIPLYSLLHPTFASFCPVKFT
jgi:hypothetical protein